MASTSFDDFVRRQSETVKPSDQAPIDWGAEKTEWLHHVDGLFAQVNAYLKPYVDAGDIVIGYRAINLNEEYIGPYSAREMLITIGSKTVKLEPIGTVILGSKGRVDAVGPLARAQLLLLNAEIKSLSDLIHVSVSIDDTPPLPPPSKPHRDIKWAWRIVTRPPRLGVVEVNKENFLSLLVEIANG